MAEPAHALPHPPAPENAQRYVHTPVRLVAGYEGARPLVKAHCVRVGPADCLVQLAEDAEETTWTEGAQVLLYPTADPSDHLPLRLRLDYAHHPLRDAQTPAVRTLHLTVEPEDTARFLAFAEAQRATVLFVDDDVSLARTAQRTLKSDRYRVLTAHSGEEALEILKTQRVAVLVTDQDMPQMTGLELLQAFSQRHPDAHTVRLVVSGHTDLDALREFVNRCRIWQFVGKPFALEHLRKTVDAALTVYDTAQEAHYQTIQLAAAAANLQEENQRLRARIAPPSAFQRILGHSQPLRHALTRIKRVAPTEVSVHVHGETGTGKELVARALHEEGKRRKGPFVAQNCAGLTESLLQSTLFGHRRGSFTGADRDRPGVFQEADGGTLFLDEVAELSPKVQGALLRVLQEGEVIRVGDTRPEKVDVRVISATHKDLRREVAEGRFREDLYFRLVVVSVELPALRAREGDVALLAHHFLQLYGERHRKHLAGFSSAAKRALSRYEWPGNVRELANEMERVVVLAEDGESVHEGLLSPHVLSESLTPGRDDGVFVSFDLPYDQAMHQVQKALIERALEEHGGIIRKAADALQMERSRLAKLRKRLGMG